MGMSERAKRAHAKQQTRKKKKKKASDRLSLAGQLLDDQVLSFREWIALNNISWRTGRRVIEGQDGPAVVQLSPRRIGITVRANREWQQSRVHPRGEDER
jgi:hypothetical protein